MKEVGISNVGISLDGLEPTHDRIRGVKGAYQQVMSGMKMMKEANLPFVVLTTVNSLNIRELPTIMKMLQSLGASRWRAQPLIPMGRVKSCRELEMNDGDILELGASSASIGLGLRRKAWRSPPPTASSTSMRPGCRSYPGPVALLGG